LSDPSVIILRGLRRNIFSFLQAYFEKMIVLFMQAVQSIEGKVGNIRKVTHLLEDLLKFLTSFPREDLHLRAPENKGAPAIEFLGQQGLDEFIGHLDQGHITPSNQIVDVIQPLEGGQSDESNHDGQEPAGEKPEEQFLGYGGTKKLKSIAIHSNPSGCVELGLGFPFRNRLLTLLSEA
jgi:hypothetical protein